MMGESAAATYKEIMESWRVVRGGEGNDQGVLVA